MDFKFTACDYHSDMESPYVCSVCSANICELDTHQIEVIQADLEDYPIQIYTPTCVKCGGKQVIEQISSQKIDLRDQAFGSLGFVFFLLFIAAMAWEGGGGEFMLVMAGATMLFSLSRFRGISKWEGYNRDISEYFTKVSTPKKQSRIAFRNISIPKVDTSYQNEQLDIVLSNSIWNNRGFVSYLVALAFFMTFGSLSLYQFLISDEINLPDLVYNQEIFSSLFSKVFTEFQNQDALFLLFIGISILITIPTILLFRYLAKFLDGGIFFTLFTIITVFAVSNYLLTGFIFIEYFIFGVIYIGLLYLYIWRKRKVKSKTTFTAEALSILSAYPSLILLNLIIIIVTALFQVFTFVTFLNLYALFSFIKNQTVVIIISLIFELGFIFIEVLTINIIMVIFIDYVLHWYKGNQSSTGQILDNIEHMYPTLVLYSLMTSFLNFVTGSSSAPDSKFSIKKLVKLPFVPFAYIFKLIFGWVWEYLDFYTLVNMLLNKSMNWSLADYIKKTAILKWYGMIDVIKKRENLQALFLVISSNLTILTFLGIVLNYVIPDIFLDEILRFIWLVSLFLVIPVIVSYSLITRLNSSFIFIYSNGIVKRDSRPDQFSEDLDFYINTSFPGLFNYRQFKKRKREMRNPFEVLDIPEEI